MARVFGLLLMIVALWLGISVYTEGTERTLAGLWGADEEQAALEDESPGSTAAERGPRGAGQAAPSAVTSRVRERVSNAVADGARRHGGE